MSTVIPGVHYKVQMYEWVGTGNKPDYQATTSWSILPPDTVAKTISTDSAIMFVVTVTEDSSHRKINQGDGVHMTTTFPGQVHATSTSFDGDTFDSSKFYWLVNVGAGKAGTSMKVTADNFNVAFDNNSSVAVSLNGGAYTGLGVIQPAAGVFPITITYTNAASKPLPSKIKEFLGSAVIAQSSYNAINKTWIVSAIVSDIYFVYSFPSPWSNPYTSPAATSVGKYTAVKYKDFDSMTKAANAAAVAGKTTAKKTTIPKPAPGGGTGTGTGTGVDADLGMKLDSQWNPPPHFATKTYPFIDALDFVSDPGNVGSTLVGEYNNSEMGRMYQDDYALNAKNPDLGLWGFRFMYNPTSISYSTNTDTTIDWTLGKSDPSNALGGNTSVSFELYLNRIFDLKYLSTGGSSEGYPITLGKEAITGITTRGTEYDLEYLYRVVNGDPQKNQALLQNNGKTADLGYITGMPFWLHINDNMRFFGSLASLSVNHVIFTQDMIPVFSTVNISFVRYPATTTTKGSLTTRAKQFRQFQAGDTTK